MFNNYCDIESAFDRLFGLERGSSFHAQASVGCTPSLFLSLTPSDRWLRPDCALRSSTERPVPAGRTLTSTKSVAARPNLSRCLRCSLGGKLFYRIRHQRHADDATTSQGESLRGLADVQPDITLMWSGSAVPKKRLKQSVSVFYVSSVARSSH